ncbi:protein containing planctomycete cytochrome C domain protein [Rhodopirellula baltica SH28]|uniref:Protein containing planctomycete cytochrome C domain protein n=2 Tax=Rhodopirellula baltica TaxID=265606 RepID=K5DLW5_RHOBT|nr:protein containing planctomycete cytochrome C domain protein [Rhodopirellula baltica SH28]
MIGLHPVCRRSLSLPMKFDCILPGTRWTRVLCSFAGTLALLTTSTIRADQPESEVSAEADSKTVEPTTDDLTAWENSGFLKLEEFCIDCHNADYQEAEVDLTLLSTAEKIRNNSELAMHSISMIRFGAMPPEDSALPTVEERRQLADQLDDLVYHATCDLRPKPGRITARRLNRAEYNNAIRDLFGMDLRPADQFPSDEVGGGFDNNADVLSLSTMLMEKYLKAGETVASTVIIDPATLPSIDKTFADQTLHTIGEAKLASFGEWFIRGDGMVWCEVEVPVEGEYYFDIRGGTNVRRSELNELKEEKSQADAEGEDSESNDSDGKKSDAKESEGKDKERRRDRKRDDEDKEPKESDKVNRCVMVHDEEGRLLEILDFSFQDKSGPTDGESFKATLKPGKHRFFFSPTDTWIDELPKSEDREDPWRIGESISDRVRAMTDEELAKTVLPEGEKIEISRRISDDEFNFKFKTVSIKGPASHNRKDLPATQSQLITRMARERSDHWEDVYKAAKTNLEPLMRRALRREVSEEEVKRYAMLVEAATDRRESFYVGMQQAITAILCSPSFLFRIELPETDEARELAATGEAVPLSSTQLASRLSFFLWSSIPDKELLQAAKENQLVDESKRQRHVHRMLDDPKSISLGEQFATQWFGLGNLKARDMADFGGNEEGPAITVDDLAAETHALFDHVLKNNLPVTELLTADYTFVNESLAVWYGVELPESDQANTFQKVSLADAGRRGILGHAGVLTLTSYPTRNSPVLRGKWILENVLGTPPPEAPPNVPELEETRAASADATLREQLELHRADPGCASCHRVMDALGFGLETMDHLGRLRPPSDPSVADANGELPGGRSFRGAMELSEMLASTETRRFADTTVRRLLSFAIGRELRPADRCFVEAILDDAEDEGFRLRDLVEGVINSPPFLTTSVPAS